MISVSIKTNSSFKSVQKFVINYFSSLLFIWFGYYFFTQVSFYHIAQYSHQWTPQWKDWNSGLTFTTQGFYHALMLCYAVGLLFHFALNPSVESKSALAFKGFAKFFIRKLGAVTVAERQAIFACAVKFFFVPFIIDAFLQHCMTINYKTCDLFRWALMDKFDQPLFIHDINHLVFEVLFAFVLFFDIVPFIVGYLVESKYLDNQIKSVESTWQDGFFVSCPIRLSTVLFLRSQGLILVNMSHHFRI